MLCHNEDYRRLCKALEEQLDLAASGDLDALKFLSEKLDGKPRQAIEHSGPEGEPIQTQTQLMPAITRDEWLAIHGIGGPAK